jgi:cysteinyl-tRNA synthetase
MTLHLYNTLTRKKEPFEPRDVANVRMYVCGPTVYDRAHLGNARSVVVYDVLYRLLCQVYGAEHVTYARNITDVDDKINAAAKQRGITIQTLTTEVTGWFHSDMASLNVLPASSNKSNGIMVEPKATDHISQMIEIIQRLIKNKHAYVAKGHVLFSVASMPSYGALSGRIQDDLEAGARVKVENYKRAAGDFVLWKPADAEDDASSIFDSPWGKGRPGWHIECSAMSHTHLGDDFDIHGGGSDLMFPHHENEIAQSRCAFPKSTHAKYWVHNGFLTVDGEKMSKSLGNFITVRDLLDKGVKGEIIRLALLKTKYREPLDWNDKLVEDARKDLDKFYRKITGAKTHLHGDKSIYNALLDDLNVPAFVAELHVADPEQLKSMGAVLGILQQDPKEWFQGVVTGSSAVTEESDSAGASVEQLINARISAKREKKWETADRIREVLKSQGILLEDRPDGSTDWRRE